MSTTTTFTADDFEGMPAVDINAWKEWKSKLGRKPEFIISAGAEQQPLDDIEDPKTEQYWDVSKSPIQQPPNYGPVPIPEDREPPLSLAPVPLRRAPRRRVAYDSANNRFYMVVIK